MAPETNPAPQQPARSERISVFKNSISLIGTVITIGSVFSFLFLLVMDAMSGHANPYVGILTYMVAPAFLFLGLGLFFLGAWLQRKRLTKELGHVAPLRFDLTMPRDRKVFAFLAGGAVFFLLLSAIGSYQTYHFTESVTFCGKTCHTVMQPELVTYLHSPHARVSCAECHIGKGAGWFVKSKLSGTYQVYATAFNKYPKPVPTPIKNLRPAQDTCEQCHWPEKFVGNLERTYNYFLTDETNTHFAVRMLLHVGGGDPKDGPLGGIHYHMNVANKIEYYPTDEARQKIPWIRVTNPQGKVTEYRAPRFTNDVDMAKVRVMDCMDCHNRPAHRYKTPSAAVNTAMTLKNIDASMRFVKSNAVFILTQTYTNEDQARTSIANYLSKWYQGDPRTTKLISEVQQIYNDNFFPRMNANWAAYPDNIGHKDWPGCFRCHDGEHKTVDGSKTVEASNCEACHTILSQGTGSELLKLTSESQKFRHPADDVDGACNDCHTGAL